MSCIIRTQKNGKRGGNRIEENRIEQNRIEQNRIEQNRKEYNRIEQKITEYIAGKVRGPHGERAGEGVLAPERPSVS